MIPENIQQHIDDLLFESESYREQAEAFIKQAEACSEAAKLLQQRFGSNGSAPVSTPTKPSPLASWVPPGPFRRRRLTKETLPSTRADWIAFVLKAAGKPLRMSEIVDGLIAEGQDAGLKRNILHNAAAVALKRKPDRFRQETDGSWSLIETGDSEEKA